MSDSDGDGLSDGNEVDLGINPLSIDIDQDGLSDSIDPTPLAPGATSGFIEDQLRKLAEAVRSFDLLVFNSRNLSASKGKKNAIANRLVSAANDVAYGDFLQAQDTLVELTKKFENQASPPDLVLISDEKTRLGNNVVLMIGLIELQ